MFESVFVINMTGINIEKLYLNDFIERYGSSNVIPEGPDLEYQYEEASVNSGDGTMATTP